MSRLHDLASFTLPEWAPASLVASQYRSALPADRNDLIRFGRLGDINDRRYYYAMSAHTSWCQIMMIQTVENVRLVCNIPASTKHWQGVRWRGIESNTQVGAREAAIKFVRSVVASRPAETLKLAQEAVNRQAHRTNTDIVAWIKQVAQDVKDADD